MATIGNHFTDIASSQPSHFTAAILNCRYLSQVIIISCSSQVQSSLLRCRHTSKHAVEYVIISFISILATIIKIITYINWITAICFYRSITHMNKTNYSLDYSENISSCMQ